MESLTHSHQDKPKDVPCDRCAAEKLIARIRKEDADVVYISPKQAWLIQGLSGPPKVDISTSASKVEFWSIATRNGCTRVEIRPKRVHQFREAYISDYEPPDTY